MVEFQITSASILGLPSVTLALSGISIVLFIKYFIGTARQQFIFRGWGERLCLQIVSLLVGLQALIWQLFYYSSSHDTIAIWGVGIAVFCGTLFWCAIYRPTARKFQVILGLVTLLQGAGFFQSAKRFMEPLDNLLYSGASLGVLNEIRDFSAMTDQGNPIVLLEREVSAEAFRLHVIASRAALVQLANQSIKSSEPQALTNCHGWVFAAGKYHLRGEDVPLILKDNGYSEVTVPQPDDVIVYRRGAGPVLHTGLVRSILGDGAVLVESKWGFASTYLHLATNQPYSESLTYHRSPRQGHAIQIQSSTYPVPNLHDNEFTAISNTQSVFEKINASSDQSTDESSLQVN